MKNLLVAQSGGPSAAINATITGVIDAGIESGRVGHVYGALNGIKGVLNENFVNLDEVCDTKDTYADECHYRYDSYSVVCIG